MKNKKLYSLFLAIIFMLNMSASVPLDVFAEVGTHTYTYDNYEVDYSVQSEWEGNQSIQVTIRNTGTESILNWALAYRAGGEVNGLWNAVSPKENIFKNAGYNYEITPNSSVSFGYTLSGESLKLPEKFEIVSKRANVTEGYEVQFDIYDDWGDGFQGAVTVTNTGSEPLEAWTLSFDTNFIISNSWGGRIIESTENSYTVASEMWTNPIMPNSSSSFGFTAAKQADTEAAATNFVLTSVKIDENTVIEEASITAEAAYDSENNTVAIVWQSAVPTGAFEILTSLDGVNFETVAAVENAAFYEYAIDSGFGVLYIKIRQNIDGNVVESNIVTVSEEDIDYELDTDEDGLPDYYEDILGTDKNKADTDGDGLSDGYEVLYLGTDPLKVDSDDNGINDGDEDFDNDGLTNAQECELGTDPNNADTDGDGLNDGAEVNTHGTDPLKYDTDSDGISDGDEITLGLNPNSAATDGTPDSERTFTQVVSSDSEVLSAVNDDSDTPFKVSLEMKSAGVAENNVYARESGYSNAIENSAIIGMAPEFVYTDGLAVEEVTIKFELENSVINNTLGTYTDESDEFKGIKRLNVFMFFEDINMLLPIETFHDEATNTVYTKTDRVGTYCLMDMELWVDALKLPADSSIFKNMKSEKNQIMLQNSLDIDAYSMYNENDNKVTLSESAELKDGFNVVFVIDMRRINTYDEFDFTKERILDICRTVLKNSPNARIYFMNQSTSLTSEKRYFIYTDLYGELIEDADGNKYSCNYFTDYSHIERQAIAFSPSQSENSKIVLSDALAGIDEECDLSRETFVLSIFNQEGVMYRRSKKDNEPIEDKDGKTVLNKLVEKNVNISVISSIDDSKKYGYARDMYKNSGGKLFLDKYDYTEDVLKHIYGQTVKKEKEDTGEYQIILSTGLTTVQLDDTVSNIYFNHGKKGIKQTDTDKDGLTDYEEINFDCGLIKINKGFVTLPTYGECIDYKDELLYVKSGLYRYDDKLITGSNSISYLRTNVNVLPIKSDPTNPDGDGDGINDLGDHYPLEFEDKDFAKHTMVLNNEGIYYCKYCDLKVMTPDAQDKLVLTEEDYLTIKSLEDFMAFLYFNRINNVAGYDDAEKYEKLVLHEIDKIRTKPDYNCKYDMVDSNGNCEIKAIDMSDVPRNFYCEYTVDYVNDSNIRRYKFWYEHTSTDIMLTIGGVLFPELSGVITLFGIGLAFDDGVEEGKDEIQYAVAMEIISKSIGGTNDDKIFSIIGELIKITNNENAKEKEVEIGDEFVNISISWKCPNSTHSHSNFDKCVGWRQKYYGHYWYKGEQIVYRDIDYVVYY